MEPATPNSYDEVPYPSHPFSQTHPDRLASVARLFGLRPPDVEQARVLELGCASGGNLLPMADSLPGATFLGVDLSQRQVDAGRQTIADAGLTNVTIEARSILELGPELGQFDYIVCHGVYSWVPTAVQERILTLCRELLAPQGVAYVSYNTNPGWRMRGIIRDLMVYHASRFKEPQVRIAQARALLDFLVQSISQSGKANDAYAILLKTELELILRQTDSYLFHDYLEEINEPLYFHQFIDRVHAAQMQYLGDAQIPTMSAGNFSAHVEKTLHLVANGVVQMEQYMDFLRNRMFRQTLICHQGLAIVRQLTPASARGLYFSAPLRAESLPVNLSTRESVKFLTAGGAALQTPEPLMKAGLVYLAGVWPDFRPFEAVVRGAEALLGQNAQPYPTQPREIDALAEGLIRCLTHGMIEMRARPAAYVTALSQHPQASVLARHEAKNGRQPTNRRHEPIQVDDVERFVLPLLDGSRTVEQLRLSVLEAVRSGQLTARREQGGLDEPGVLEQVVSQHVDQALARLARGALLVA